MTTTTPNTLPPLNYVCMGDGSRDVLLIHGWGSSHKMWLELMEMAPPELDLRFWAVDLIGHGDTPAVENCFPAIDDDLDALLTFVNTHNLRPWAVMGHSMGGRLSLRLALDYPHLVPRLVLMAPAVSGKFGPFDMRWLMTTPLARSIGERTEFLWTVLRGEWLMRFFSIPGNSLTPLFGLPSILRDQDLHRMLTDFQKMHWSAAIGGALSIAHEDLTPRLHEVEQPTLLFYGDHDLMVLPGDGVLAATYLPNVQVQLYPKGSHHVLEEQPEDIAGQIWAFIRTQQQREQAAQDAPVLTPTVLQ